MSEESGVIESSEDAGQVVEIPVELIDPNPHQPRRLFDQAALTQLATAIRERGLIQPIMVRADGDRYNLVVGERRLRAHKEIGWPTIRAIVSDMSQEEAREAALIENIQRADLTPIEEALAMRELVGQYGDSYAQAADAIGLHEQTMRGRVSLLKLSDYVQERLHFAELNITVGNTIASYASKLNDEEQKQVADWAIALGMGDPAKVRNYIENTLGKTKRKKEKHEKSVSEQDVINQIIKLHDMVESLDGLVEVVRLEEAWDMMSDKMNELFNFDHTSNDMED